MVTATVIDNLIRIRTALDVVKARDADLQVRIRNAAPLDCSSPTQPTTAMGYASS
jgi:hypothetical protein